ncbi:adenosylhomocysteine nucleosidase [Andreprevotia lacus DSM 23236]|jgi:adenosylhomocysteine nucleosidase/futalosine hydrolase|uniref:Adenosylhomocysteine nucleosidase n=1 Tax=Andreprevotia lacus DSM 23236 TaxID=1121001 RepID=A0A1W1XVM7_9NEIS|nr:purine phosphorylase [Andreprevotia lacus]SMC28040.1 adenosylhomocysteine nucleosidase [Andreprevotia lacus DSM 23236]
MKIIVVFPTRTEARYFSHDAVETAICGVGLTAAAYTTGKLIHERRPDVLILAGIAGVYAGSSLKIGDTVLVASEREADLGFFTAGGFRHLSKLDLDMDFDVNTVLHCPHLPAQPPLPLAHSNSMNAALAPFIDTDGIDIENMEGAAFFHACLQAGQRFYELRSVSNRVTLEDEAWDFDASIRNLTDGLHVLINWLQAEPAQP